jgi:hypothetical protein
MQAGIMSPSFRDAPVHTGIKASGAHSTDYRIQHDAEQQLLPPPLLFCRWSVTQYKWSSLISTEPETLSLLWIHWKYLPYQFVFFLVWIRLLLNDNFQFSCNVFIGLTWYLFIPRKNNVPLKGGPPACGLGEGLTTPHHKKNR